MIIVKFQGRLGNQMFQYAFASSISKKFKTFFLIECQFENVFFKYFESKSISRFKSINYRLLNFFKNKCKKNISQNGTENLNEMQNKFGNSTYYDGFFQSDFFFENIKETIKHKLIIKKKYSEEFFKKYGQLYFDHKILAIHCRLGDYLNWGSEELGGKNLTLPQSYYKNALGKINRLEDYKIIIVTDDVKNIEDRFDFIENKTIVSEDEIIDFQILQNAHQLIISNSSFSWWAAYLNTNSALVYAPEYWLGFKVQKEYPVGIIPERFIKIPVY